MKKENVLGWVIAVPFIGAILYWYNHVWIQWPIVYWQWVVFGVAFTCVNKKVTQVPMMIIGTVALFAQIAAWMHLITLPLIK